MRMPETRNFKVSPHIIFSLIKAQAGTLGKAITECVMNSVDALATEVHIDLTARTVRIQDDGTGFQTRDEIEAWFETLGFDHTDEGNHRAFGSFGIGRAQLWSFASTVWRTHRFVMDVDIKNKGLDYELNEFGDQTEGLVIDGTFYSPLSDGQLAAIEQELRTLIKYVEIPVYLNGKNLCSDPSKETWDFETPDAWFRFDTSKRSRLVVYNMGVFVKDYWFNQYHLGGLVVTKPRVKLALNMARNDVLVAECKNWARITEVLRANSAVEDKAKKTEKLSEEEYATRAMALLEDKDVSIYSEDVFVDIRGRNRNLWGIQRNGGLICFADPKDEKAKRAHSLKLACVLKHETLKRFGAKNAADLKAMLVKAPALEHVYYAKRLAEMQFFDSLAEALPNLDDQYDVIADKDLTPVESALLKSLTKAAQFLSRVVSKGYGNDPMSVKTSYPGAVRAGKSDKALSWCFAGDIVIERRLLKDGHESFQGFSTLCARALHEQLAGLTDSNLEHTHDGAFYEAFHHWMLQEEVHLQFRYGYQFLAKLCARKHIDLSTKTLADMSGIV
jgi:hypothetical protein